ncbi:M64 family metallopeptidase [Streptomyces sp. BHT-5-2]|uniref:M64 family metallopeptidase n=1 Tax=Streptomyces sp. BHT-5-2 TaxID=2866715 RepID=UPI0021B0F42B|nr:M64 family metallopeptidase [Streptomyces sp. BHT-5-2]
MPQSALPPPTTHRRRRGIRTVIGACALTLPLALAGLSGSAAAAPTPAPTPTPVPIPQARVEVPGPAGGAAGSGYRSVPRTFPHAPKPALTAAGRAADGQVTKVIDNGDTKDRLDVVVIGDGYTADQLDQFHQDVKNKWNDFLGVEPYRTYQKLFNVWSVDAVSTESGVSGDPGKDVVRNTALGARFWCDDTERLLCIDQQKVDAYVAKAPQADLVIVLANSAKYGGAGYNEPSQTLGYDGIATVSAHDENSSQVAVHETGHSLGKLADEYSYPGIPGYEQYTGPEKPEPNSSVLTADAMAGARAKWYRWLGATSPDGGPVGAYEGGNYYVKGLYRPTEDSLMRTLGKPFNLPGSEAMIAGFYRHATPAAPAEHAGAWSTTARLALPRPNDARHGKVVTRWYLDGHELRRYRDHDRVTLRQLALGRGTHHLSATVTDATSAVRDPAVRATLTRSTTWTVQHGRGSAPDATAPLVARPDQRPGGHP